MNARDEFIQHIENRKVLCAKMLIGDEYYGSVTAHILKIGYSDADWGRFISSLNLEYDEGFGGRELRGLIWYEDGTWSERGEYDGSEWWEYKIVPEIPDDLK